MAHLDSRMANDRGKLLVTFGLLALLPLIPYLLFGYRGQDFLFHVHSWADLYFAWQSGSYFPGWATHANYTLGDPRFLYYPPVSFLLGAALSACLPAQLAPAAFVCLASVLAGVCMYAASRPFVRRQDRIAAAVLYVLSPYFIVTWLSRFAVAELLVQSWLPLVLFAFYKSTWLDDRRATAILSVLLGLCWLTNVPEAIVLFYTLLLAALAVTCRRRSLRALAGFLLAEVTAACLAAFYLLPVIAEKHLINSNAVLHFDQWLILAHSRPQSLEITCWLTACLSFIVIVSCAWRNRRSPSADFTTAALVDLSVISFFFQLPLSIFLWEHLPDLKFVQFSFRFLPILGFAVPLMLLKKESGKYFRITIYVLLAVLAARPFGNYWRIASHNKRDTRGTGHLTPFAEGRLSGQEQLHGWMGTDEYIPAGASMPASPAKVPEITSVTDGIGGHCAAVMQSRAPDHLFFTTYSDLGCRVRLPLFDFPYWTAMDLHGDTLPVADEGGFAVVSVPPGDQRIQLRFNPTSAYRTLGRFISIFASLILAILYWITSETRISSKPKMTATTLEGYPRSQGSS